MDENLRREYQNQRKEDFIDRKTGFIERMFDKLFFAASRDVKSTIIVVLIMTNFWSLLELRESDKDRISDIQEYSDRITEEVRRRLIPEINKKVDARTEKIETKVDSASTTLEYIKDEITKSIKNNLE